MYSTPFADDRDGARPRLCNPAGIRNYKPRHEGIGFEVLDLESEACFVPDSAYVLLDDIIDTVIARLNLPASAQGNGGMSAKRARAISRVTGDVLVEKGFGLYIPTETLGDMLVPRNRHSEGPPRYTTDCDTSALVLLTIAEVLGAKAALVEMTLAGGAGHNFVRWQLGENQVLDWDTNGRAPCIAPDSTPPYQGFAMSHDQVISYILGLRAQKWLISGNIRRSLNDNRRAISLFPEHPDAYNDFAWTVATRSFKGRHDVLPEAMRYAHRLLDIERVPGTIDTAACVAALDGNFKQAILLENEALSSEPNNGELRNRLARFTSDPPRDCTGADSGS